MQGTENGDKRGEVDWRGNGREEWKGTEREGRGVRKHHNDL